MSGSQVRQVVTGIQAAHAPSSRPGTQPQHGLTDYLSTCQPDYLPKSTGLPVGSFQFPKDLFERRNNFVLAGVALVELQAQVERLCGWPERKHECLRAPGFRLFGFLAELLARCATLAGDAAAEKELRELAASLDTDRSMVWLTRIPQTPSVYSSLPAPTM